MRLWKKDEQIFERLFKKLQKADLKKLSKASLAQAWERYHIAGVKRFTSSAIIDHFALGTDELVADMLKKEVTKYGRNLKTSDLAKIFAVASAPTRQSFISEAEISLLKIILGKSKDSLKDHQKKFFWTSNNYIRAHVLSVAEFEQEIKAWKQSKKNLAEELRQIEETPARNKIAKQKLFRQYKLSVFLRTLLQISDDFTAWQDQRKRATYLNIHMGCQILSAIAKKAHYTLDELKYAGPSEIPDIIKSGNPSRKILQERMKGSAVIATRQYAKFFTGRDVEALKSAMFGRRKQEEVDDFRGLSASTGKAIGPVKVLKSSSEVGKVRAGDILVAVMTRPDYVVAMKKAAAIVTNEGGITSHAAIVSRELGIPCIIGTKIATEVLKDGDIVEVNANHGWVRKIK
ncbi:MAG: hypothetical protein HYV13_04030 [Candidatus Doudnabacteria bacterium]|nr:hypothetical protein [Candidatus Doudnabacteria bacterium]